MPWIAAIAAGKASIIVLVAITVAAGIAYFSNARIDD